MALQLLLILGLLLSPQPLMALQLQLLSDKTSPQPSLILSDKMSPQLSLKALESLSDKLSPVVSQIIELASGLGEDKDTALVKFVLDCICKIDDLVRDFIKELGGDNDNEGFLKAYYDAILKCKTAVANINRETSSSYTQLKTLRGAESPKFNSLISDLEAVKTAYEVVIGLCSQKMKEAPLCIASALIVGLIVLSVCVVMQPVVLSSTAGAETFTVGVGEFQITGYTLTIAKQIWDLIGLMSNLKQQWELLTTQTQTQTQTHVGGLLTTQTQTQTHVGGLIVGISKIQTKVEVLQTALQSTWEIAASAQRIKDLLRDPTIRSDLKQQISELKKLSGGKLTKNAEKAFEFFERQVTTTGENVLHTFKALPLNTFKALPLNTFFPKKSGKEKKN